MVDRVKGGPKQGVWFSADVRFLALTVVGSTFTADLAADPAGVNSDLEQVLEAIATRGTVIGLTVASDTVVNVMVDYAQAYDDAAVVTEVEALIDAIAGLSGATFVVEAGFGAQALA